jgi:hypothetical protein
MVKEPEEPTKLGLPEGLQITQDEDRGFKDQRQGKYKGYKLNRLRKQEQSHHQKKLFDIPVPSRDVTYQTLPGQD